MTDQLDQLYRFIIDSSNDAIITKSTDGKVLSWNSAAERIFGYSAEEMIGEPMTSLYPEALRDEEGGLINRVLEGNTISHIRTNRLTRDGTEITVSLSISPIYDDAGTIVAVSKIARDVTESEAQFRQLERLAAIVDSSQDPIISKDLNGVATSWNKAAERVFGYTAEEMIGSPVTKIFPPELVDEESFILSQIRSGLRVDHMRSERVSKSGQRIPVSLTISPIHNADGSICGASVILRDISAEIEAEQTVEQFRAIIESSDDAIISKDMNGIVTSWNRGAERIFGYTAEEMIGQPMIKIFPSDKIFEEEIILGKIAAGERLDHFETKRVRKNGDLVDISVTISPITVNGKVIGASKVARDITFSVAQREELWRKANYDTLTGLPNRAYFMNLLSNQHVLGPIGRRHYAVLFVDLDKFKQLNDTYGHAFADVVIQLAGKRMRSALRSTDTVARIGGDEFVILIPRVDDTQQVEVLAEKIVSRVCEPMNIEGQQITASCSLGAAIYPDHAEDSEQLLKLADEAMYISKNRGRNNWTIYHPDAGQGDEQLAAYYP